MPKVVPRGHTGLMTDGPATTMIVGHLAHPDRRRVIAALILGATSREDIMQLTGLGTRAVVTALGRLGDGGLVLTDEQGRLRLAEEGFRHAAIETRPDRGDEIPSDVPDEAARVLRPFLRKRRLLSIPAQHAKRLLVLDLLAQDFEPGRRYDERTVNTVLRRWHEDAASLRRYLVDEGFLDRQAGQYWRVGGTVST